MRLIDADELIEFIEAVWPVDSTYGITSTTVLKQIVTDIKNTRTIKTDRPKDKWVPINAKYASAEEIKQGVPYVTLDCPIPSEGEHTLVTDGKNVWIDTWEYDGGWYLGDSDLDPLDITAWMPLPEPYKADMREDSNV